MQATMTAELLTNSTCLHGVFPAVVLAHSTGLTLRKSLQLALAPKCNAMRCRSCWTEALLDTEGTGICTPDRVRTASVLSPSGLAIAVRY